MHGTFLVFLQPIQIFIQIECNAQFYWDLVFLWFLKPFLANVPIFYPLKTPDNQKFSSIFRGYKMGILIINKFTKILCFSKFQNFFSRQFNSFMMDFPIKQKPVHSFAVQIIANQWTGFYMIGNPVMKQLITDNFFIVNFSVTCLFAGVKVLEQFVGTKAK